VRNTKNGIPSPISMEYMVTPPHKIVLPVVSNVRFFMDLVVRKSGRRNAKVETDKIPGFILSHFHAAHISQPTLMFMAIRGEEAYCIRFREEDILIDRASTDHISGEELINIKYTQLIELNLLHSEDLNHIKQHILMTKLKQ